MVPARIPPSLPFLPSLIMRFSIPLHGEACRPLFRSVALLLTVFLVSGISAAAQDRDKTPKAKKVVIKAVEGLQFSPVRVAVKKGERIELHLENHDPNDQPHNFVLSKIGSLKEIQTASMAIGPDAVANGFIPESESILVHSKLLNPEEKDVLTFEAPKKSGVYPYICTFPGHALVMYGALYVDTKIREELAYDPHVPEIVRKAELEKKKALLAVDRPTMQRLFMPDAGPAAIAVAVPGDLNYCWDAGNCRLRYAWKGGFVDATRMWNSNGNSLGRLLGDVFWQSEPGEKVHGIRFGDEAPESVKFRGYDLVDGLPAFRYEVDGAGVRESIREEGESLAWSFEIEPAPSAPVRILVPEAETARVSATAGSREGDHWMIPADAASRFTLTLSPR